jgi:hypothetical protein
MKTYLGPLDDVLNSRTRRNDRTGVSTISRIDMQAFMMGMRITSSRPSTDNMLNFSIYKNVDIFSPL